MNLQENSSQQLKRTMKSRHLFMISLGGVIGTGLFLSTGYTLHQAGSGGTILAYVIGGLMMYLVMQCLGELSVAMPVTGSFQKYATTFIGPSTGFMVGIMYWINWVVTVGSEFTASGILMQRWFPDSSVWMWSAIFAALLFICNAFSVKLFAETEFWFSSVKIVTIILFIILGGAAMFSTSLFKRNGGCSYAVKFHRPWRAVSEWFSRRFYCDDFCKLRFFRYRVNRRYSRRISKSSKRYSAIHP